MSILKLECKSNYYLPLIEVHADKNLCLSTYLFFSNELNSSIQSLFLTIYFTVFDTPIPNELLKFVINTLTLLGFGDFP